MRVSAPWQIKCYVGILVCAYALTTFALDPEKRITQFAHQSWGGADGLDAVFSVAQTTDGYIWIGAANGLFRFDGFHFNQLEARPGEKRVPGHPARLLGAHDGSLWIASAGHMLRLQNDRMNEYPLPGVRPGDGMTGIQEGRDGTIWAATGFGLFKFRQGRWEKVDLPVSYQRPRIVTLLVSRDDTVWAGIFDWDKPGRDRVVFLRPGETNFHTLFEAESTGARRGNALYLTESREGRIWLSTISSIRVLRDDGRTPYFADTTISVLADKACFDRDGNLWMSWPDSGLARLSRLTLEQTNSSLSSADIHDRFTRQDALSSDRVNCFFEDREGNVWTGTGGGLDCFSETKVTALSRREGLAYDANLSIQATPDGSIWAFSGVEGLERIETHPLQFTSKGWTPFPAMRFSAAFCLYAEPEGSVLAGTSRGLGRIKDGTMSRLALPKGLELKTVIAITRDDAGGLWLCDYNEGVVRVLKGELEWFPELHRSRTEYAIAVHADRAGRAWFGYVLGGIACYDRGQVRRFDSQDGLFSGQVRALFGDDHGRVWAAGDGGLSRFENGRFRTLTQGNGLPDDEVYAVLEDDEQFFWIASVHGLFRVAVAQLDKALDGSIRTVDGQVFEVKDGIRGIVHHPPSDTYYLGGCYTVATKGPDGTLWFSTSEGLAIVDPRHIPKNQVLPAVHVQQIIAAGKTNYSFERLNFPKGTKKCEIEYVGLSFANPSRVGYEYRLEGYDVDWVKAGARRQAFYSGLRPAAYRFQVRACNSDGVRNETGDSVEFSIAPAIYETAWFPGLCLAAFASALFGLYRLRLRGLAARMNLQLAAEQNERKRIAQELHDTLLQGFTGVGLKLDALTSSLPDSMAETKEKFRKTLEQTDQYLSEGRRSVWKLRSSTLENTGDFSIALDKASQRALNGTDIALSLSVRGQSRKLKDFIEDNLLRICEEAVANAVKHARPTRIEVTLIFDSRNVQLRISDNGCGFDAKQSKDGHFGLVGMQERAKSMGGSFSLNSELGVGTEMTVTVRAKTIKLFTRHLGGPR